MRTPHQVVDNFDEVATFIVLLLCLHYHVQCHDIVLLMFSTAAYTTGSLGGNGASLTVLTPNECGTCLGHQLLYECITVGTIGTTVWKGSAFQCPDNGNNVLLSHRQFSSGTMDACNNGAIVGRSIRAVNNCYISQLNVTVSASMNGQTIQCFYNNESREIEIGIETITIREGITSK